MAPVMASAYYVESIRVFHEKVYVAWSHKMFL